ncbi:MAG: HD domain-containing phosphohydrolase, partial [Clostridium sp.]|nr:HD domain-containing phosphohydrolase [Clostridium sp.]
MKKGSLLNVSELKQGMIISKDIIENGTLLVKKGTIITDELISLLKKSYFLEKIEIDVSDVDISENSKELELKNVEESFKQVAHELQEMFSKMNKIRKTDLDELREFAVRIQNQLNYTEVVVCNVVFKGSGNDNIYRHGVNVAVLSALIGRWIGLEKSKINLLIYSALLHDFGITKLDQKYQRKPDIIMAENYKEVKEHAKIAYKCVDLIPYLDKSVSYGVLMHHEREDGSGYPLGLKGDAIHSFGKIIAIADVFDAINSNRGYKRKKAPFEALQIVKNESLGKLNYEYVKVFLEHIVNYYLGE